MTDEKRITGSSELLLYKSTDGSIQLDVQLENETIWLNAHQLGELFARDRTVVIRHLRNVYKTGELNKESTCAKIAQVAADGKIRQMDIFNLDAIISVGYRVNSKRGTDFRIWATNVLRQHIVQGYTVNEHRLKQLKKVVKLASDISKRKVLTGDEASVLLQVVSEYAGALDLLDDYDHQRVKIGKTSRRKAQAVTYEETLKLVDAMREKFGDSSVFGKEKDSSLHSSLNAIMQSFDGKDVYPSVEEKAA